MSQHAPQDLALRGTDVSVGIVAARFNPQWVDALLAQVMRALEAAGVRAERIRVERVPGSNELPVAAQWLAKGHAHDVIVALGVLVRGDTIHYQLVAETASHGLQRVALDEGIPVINGVVVAENAAQAQERCGGKIDRGAEFARAALEMAHLRRKVSL